MDMSPNGQPSWNFRLLARGEGEGRAAYVALIGLLRLDFPITKGKHHPNRERIRAAHRPKESVDSVEHHHEVGGSLGQHLRVHIEANAASSYLVKRRDARPLKLKTMR